MNTHILILAPDNSDIIKLANIFDPREFTIETFSLSNFIADRISKSLPDIILYDDDLNANMDVLLKSLMPHMVLIGLLTEGRMTDKALEELLEKGMHDYVFKPVEEEELLSRVKMQLSIRNSSNFFE